MLPNQKANFILPFLNISKFNNLINLCDRVIGVVVDGVSDVMNIKNEQIGEVPALVANIDAKWIGISRRSHDYISRY